MAERVIREAPCRFGSDDALSGVLCRPATPDGSRSVVLLISAGLLHRVGPCRQYVHLSRDLAALGHEALRLDLAGIGESARRGDPDPSRVRSGEDDDRDGPVRDIRAAIDHLARSGPIERCTLVGLCSGADDALRAAERDDRVTGCVLIDGVAYRDRSWWLHRLLQYPRRALDPSRWREQLARSRVRHEPEEDLRSFGGRERTRDLLAGLVGRDCRLHLIYTGGVDHYYNNRRQFGRLFPEIAASPRVRIDYFPRMDHLAVLCADREELRRAIVTGLGSACPERAADDRGRLPRPATSAPARVAPHDPPVAIGGRPAPGAEPEGERRAG